MVRSPRQHARRLRIDSGSSSRLLHTNLFLTAAMLVPGVMPVHGEWLMIVPFAWLFMYAGLLLLTFIETVGLRFFARAAWRRWRVTPAVAWTVCDHASVGWVVGGLLNLLFVAAEPVARLARWEWGNELAKRLIGVPITAFVSDTTALRVYASLLLGMLTFETLVFIGVRQCRWANTPASVSQQGPGCAGGSRDAATPDA
ncbi:MAG: hypothetical protein K2Q09_03165 [Phycisphaerales bacterium]|nr:hypothetical protein [Phycisphaerales bacterium]